MPAVRDASTTPAITPRLAGDAFSAPEAGQALTPPARWKEGVAVAAMLVSWAIVAFVSAAATVREYGQLSAESSGYFVGRIIGAFLVSLLGTWIYYRARNRRPTLAHRMAVVSAWAAFLSLFALAGEAGRTPVLNQAQMYQHVGDLVKQASGEAPVAQDQTWYDGPVRAFYVDIFAWNREYGKTVDIEHRVWLKRAYSPESYASRENIEATAEELRQILAVDEKYESIEPLLAAFETRVRAAKARQREKDGLIQGIREGSSKSFAARQETFRAEKAWLLATIELYRYMSAHLADYSVKANKLVFRVEGPREEFRTKQANAIALRDTAIKAKEQLDAAREESLSKIGITHDPQDKQGKTD